MEYRINHITDEQAIVIMRDFVRTQEKLIEERNRSLERSGSAPPFSHYTSAETALVNFKEMMAA